MRDGVANPVPREDEPVGALTFSRRQPAAAELDAFGRAIERERPDVHGIWLGSQWYAHRGEVSSIESKQVLRGMHHSAVPDLDSRTGEEDDIAAAATGSGPVGYW